MGTLSRLEFQLLLQAPSKRADGGSWRSAIPTSSLVSGGLASTLERLELPAPPKTRLDLGARPARREEHPPYRSTLLNSLGHQEECAQGRALRGDETLPKRE